MLKQSYLTIKEIPTPVISRNAQSKHQNLILAQFTEEPLKPEDTSSKISIDVTTIVIVALLLAFAYTITKQFR